MKQSRHYVNIAASQLIAAANQWEDKPASVLAQNNVALAGVYAQLALVDVMQDIAVSLAALVELGSNTDFTDKLDEEGELPF